MKPSEIIAADAKKMGVDPNKALAFVSSVINQKAGLLLQKNDSVLLLQRIPGNNAELHLFSMDRPMTLVKSLKYFIDIVKKSDLRAVYGKTNNQQILELLVTLGFPVQESDNERYNWMAFI